jgi:hypothetical protein
MIVRHLSCQSLIEINDVNGKVWSSVADPARTQIRCVASKLAIVLDKAVYIEVRISYLL